jgi:hypothetical protein
MKHKQLSKLVALAESMGFTVDDVARGKHFKLYLTTPAGKKVLTVSISASDHRAVKNNASIMRGWAA